MQTRSANDAKSVGQNRHTTFCNLQGFENEKADRLTHEAREKGASWNSFKMMEGSKLEAVRACFDGGVSRQGDRNGKRGIGVCDSSVEKLKTLQRRWNG